MAFPALPSDWLLYTGGQKLAWFKANGITADDLTKMGEAASDVKALVDAGLPTGPGVLSQGTAEQQKAAVQEAQQISDSVAERYEDRANAANIAQDLGIPEFVIVNQFNQGLDENQIRAKYTPTADIAEKLIEGSMSTGVANTAATNFNQYGGYDKVLDKYLDSGQALSLASLTPEQLQTAASKINETGVGNLNTLAITGTPISQTALTAMKNSGIDPATITKIANDYSAENIKATQTKAVQDLVKSTPNLANTDLFSKYVDQAKGYQSTIEGVPGVDFKGSTGLREAYGPYVTDYLSRMSALLGLRDAKNYQPTMFGTTAAGGTYGAETANTLADIQAQREGMMGMGANKTPAYQPYQYSFAPKLAASGGIMSLVDGYADGGEVEDYQTGGMTGAQAVPSTFDTPNTFSPTTYTSGYTAPTMYQAPTAGITTGTFDTAAQGNYMSPYMSGVVNPQLREAKRQSEIQGMTNAAKFSQAGAFGGTRNILAEAERQRNLNTQLGDIYGAGQQKAFENAQQQFERDQARKLQSQVATEQARQAAGQQGITSAQIAGQLGLDASRLSEQSKQFGANLGLQTAQSEAQYQQLARDLQQRAEEAQARGDQFGASLALQQLQEAQRAAESSRAFEYQQARDTYLDPFRELMYANQVLSGLPISSAATGISPATESIIAALGLNKVIGG